jgi:hypothetical protein
MFKVSNTNKLDKPKIITVYDKVISEKTEKQIIKQTVFTLKTYEDPDTGEVFEQNIPEEIDVEQEVVKQVETLVPKHVRVFSNSGFKLSNSY